MKKLLAILIVAIILCGLAACTEDEPSQTTTHNASGNHDSATTTTRVDGVNSTTSHQHSVSTTTHGIDPSEDGDITDKTTNNDGDEGGTEQGGTDTHTTTVHSSHTTTSNVITTTTKKGETTKKTEITTTTTKKTTTTTTKKITTTTTKKTTTTTHKHTFSAATYKKADINKHTVTGKCSSCGASTSQTEWHTWGAWKYDVQPTATKEGVKYRVCTGCGEEQVTVAPATSVNTSNYAQEVFELVNAERAKYSLPALKYYTNGQSGANTRAKELMIYFSHNRPDGTKWWTVSSFDRSVCQAGAENIARGHGSPEDVVAAFMASADHRKNILSTAYTHIVVGYYEGAWVQIFVKPW